jgi:hypothetical protein
VSGGCRGLCGHQLFHGFSSVSVSEVEGREGVGIGPLGEER